MSAVKQKVAALLPTGRWFGLDAVSSINMSNTAFLQYMRKIRGDNPDLIERRIHATTKIVTYKWGKEIKAAYIKKLKGGDEIIMSKSFELLYKFMRA